MVCQHINEAGIKTKKKKELKIFPSDDKALSHRQCLTVPQFLSETQAHPFRTPPVPCFILLSPKGGHKDVSLEYSLI